MWNTMICGLVLLALSVSAVAETRAPITVDTVLQLTLEMAFDAGFVYYELGFLTDEIVAVAGRDRFLFWDISSGDSAELVADADGKLLCLSPDRSRLALLSPSNTVEIWSTDPLERQLGLGTLKGTTYTRGAFSPDGQLFAFVNRWNEVDVWNLDLEERVLELFGLRSNVFDLAFSPDGRLLAGAGGTSSQDDHGVSLVCVWDLSSGELTVSLPTDDVGDNHAITFSADGSHLVTTGIYRILAWEAVSWERTYDSGPSHPGSYGISVAPDGRLLAVASDARSILLIDLETMDRERTIRTGAEILNVDFSPDGTRLAASGLDGAVRIWTVR